MRYAIYYTAPADHPLTQLGARWLGRDAFSGEHVVQPRLEGLTESRFDALTAEPRRYGFHATMKPPFVLAQDFNETDLREAFKAFCERMPAFDVPGLAVTRLGAFLALTPSAPVEALDVLAASCVETFDAFRAPLTRADRARRLAGGLTARQIEHLDRWGYPYVFDEFRFHMTLSGRLTDPAEADLLFGHAQIFFAEATGRPHRLATLGLFVEPAPGADFTVLDIRPLGRVAAETDRSTVHG